LGKAEKAAGLTIFLTLGKEHKLKVFENKLLKKVCGSKTVEVTENKEELRDLDRPLTVVADMRHDWGDKKYIENFGQETTWKTIT
jgi:hypothetical protein